MNYIGNVIKEVRCNQAISRNQLSENICTEKYLYLIETGKRTPSSEILHLFSVKLGRDLFEFYQYLDYSDPIKVCEVLKQFNLLRSTANFEELKKFSDTLVTLPDFQINPLKYEMEVNRISYTAFFEHQYNTVISETKELLDNLEPKYSEAEFTANLYLLLSTSYQVFNDLPAAQKALSEASKIVKNKQNIAKYSQVIGTVRLNTMTFCHKSGEYETAIAEGMKINQNYLETNSYRRANFTYYYLAYAYYKKGMMTEAFEWFEKCLYELLIHYSPIPAYYISNYDLFYELLEDSRISHNLKKKIINKYDCIR